LVDRTLASLVLALDRSLRWFGGALTHALADNERTATVDHVCGIPVRNAWIVSVCRHYGLTVATCVPADPHSKGGVDATVWIAKADIVPTDHNLRSAYASFAELEQACRDFCARVNAREHRATRRAPAAMLADERRFLHPLPGTPHTLAFGETRRALAVDDLSRRRPLLGPQRLGRRARLGARRGRGAGRRPRRLGGGRARGRPPPADDAGPAADPGRPPPPRRRHPSPRRSTD
jgi:hypothetical protein